MWLGGLLSRFSVQRFPGAAVAQVPAPVAAARPRQQFRAGVLGDGPDPTSLAWPLCHGAVARHLVGYRRGRPAQVAGHLPARPALVQAVLDGRPLGPVQPAVCLLLLLPLLLSFLSGGPSALASGKEFSNSGEHVRVSMGVKAMHSDELANQPVFMDLHVASSSYAAMLRTVAA